MQALLAALRTGGHGVLDDTALRRLAEKELAQPFVGLQQLPQVRTVQRQGPRIWRVRSAPSGAGGGGGGALRHSLVQAGWGLS